jgi:SAM-dependent methyltransferase
MQRCLMLGAGFTKPKRIMKWDKSAPEEETSWVTLDSNPDCKPDVLFDLNNIERGNKLPFPDEHFAEIHAYEVMEHYGHQGDFHGFFTGMHELWRVLEPGGVLIGSTPKWNSYWAWSDPGHRRVISSGTLMFLTPPAYDQLGKTALADYRRLVDPHWWLLSVPKPDDDRFYFALVKILKVE